MTILYFSLTPFLGMTDSLAGGMLLGLSWLVLIILEFPILWGLGQAKISSRYKIAVAALVNILLVFVLDLIFYLVIGPSYLAYQLYVRLLAFNPLLIYFAFREDSPADFSEGLVFFLRITGFLLAASVLAGMFREFLGAASFTPWLGLEPLVWNEVRPWMPQFMVGPVGGFLTLSLFGYILGRFLDKPSLRARRVSSRPAPSLDATNQTPEPFLVIQEEIPETIPELIPAAPQPSEQAAEIETTTGPEVEEGHVADLAWGESETELLESLRHHRPFDKKRILVIGCGTGEIVYEMAIRLLSLHRDKGHANFRIRGIDTFQTRIETAREGVYRESQFPNLTDEQKSRYLLRHKHEEARLVKVSQEPRLYVEFLNTDFLSPSIFFQKPADLIVVNFELDFLPLPKLVQLFVQLRSNLHHEGALLLRHEAPREAWSHGWKKTGNQVLRKLR